MVLGILVVLFLVGSSNGFCCLAGQDKRVLYFLI